jgi:mercuric reductase
VLTPGGIRLSDGRGVTAGRVVLTTGASSWAPPIEGLAGAGYLDYVSAMALDRLPDSLVVVGAGGVGLELGQMFARLGLEVTILEGLPRVAPTEDPAVGAALAEYLRQEGLDVHVEVRVDRVDRRPGGYIVTFSRDGTTCLARGERLLMATGRRPNTGGLGLAPMGVTLGTKGEVVVDRFLQTGNPDIYAAGDVTGDPMFVNVAAYGGSVAAENALTSNRQVYDLSPLPRVTFTDPAVASVGLTEEEARARGVEVLVSQLPLEHVPRSVAARDTRGFVKLVADASTRRIVGAHILAAEAGEMITEAVTAIRFGLTIEDIVSMFHPYLTLSEGIKLAAQGFTRDLANLSCCAA